MLVSIALDIGSKCRQETGERLYSPEGWAEDVVAETDMV